MKKSELYNPHENNKHYVPRKGKKAKRLKNPDNVLPRRLMFLGSKDVDLRGSLNR